LNKILYLRPPNNIYTFNEVVALWEKKIGKTLQKIYVLEDKLLEDIEGWYNYAKLVRNAI
jgi:pterocarpan reductase